MTEASHPKSHTQHLKSQHVRAVSRGTFRKHTMEEMKRYSGASPARAAFLEGFRRELRMPALATAAAEAGVVEGEAGREVGATGTG